MNKKVYFIIPLLILIVVNLSIIFNSNKSIPTYDSDIVCSYSSVDTQDDEEYSSKNIIYITKDKDNVRKVINQSIMSSNADTGLLESIIDLYDSVEGIDASLKNVGDSIVFEVTYNYDKIDLDLTKEKLGSVLSDDSILMSTKELPISVDDYLEYLNENYKCEVK